MKITTGIDLVEINRIQDIVQRSRFLHRFFSQEEIDFFIKKSYSPASIAANFAGKEAFSKALGTGVRGFSLSEVSILRDEHGSPYIKLSGDAKKAAGDRSFSISLTHTDTAAAAVVVAYTE